MDWDFELKWKFFARTRVTSEGPVWDGEAILFTDIPNRRIMRYNPDSGEVTSYGISRHQQILGTLNIGDLQEQ